ncbi:MAG: RsmB/NOP family class I SAM-dependent RNA methyltransferase [Candidatus Dojkabacteria bacterium]|nr:MAG: RsmB/NOP family class I SAM-dependent RNA methyltransferase [Candidatus Dojkabacteria bacterium]
MKRTRSNYKQKRGKQQEERFFTKEEIFLSRLASILKMSKKDVRNHFSQRTVSTIRLNNLAANPDDIEKKLLSKGIQLEQVPWSKHTFIVTNKDKSELGKMEEYRKGLFYIQNLSSMLPGVILNPSEGDYVLDMCAAPGSKTTQLAAMMNNKGEIIANDENFQRLSSLKRVLSEFHVTNAKVTIGDAAKLGHTHQNKFSKILLDAPCSGEGMIYLKGEKPLRFWNIKKIKAMVKVQERLILSAFDALKPGGEMVYSTCTLEPDENEGVVTRLLRLRKDVEILEIPITGDAKFDDYRSFVTSGITKWSGNFYDRELRKAIRVIPGSRMQAFFIVKIKKVV